MIYVDTIVETQLVHEQDINKFGKVPSLSAPLYNNEVWYRLKERDVMTQPEIDNEFLLQLAQLVTIAASSSFVH